MSFKDSFRHLRRSFKAKLPYVRRREYRKLQNKYDEIVDGLGWTPAANMARLDAIKPIAQPLTGEVCLFVTYAPSPQLKDHVATHIRHLLRAGVKVVLIANTELAPEEFVLDAALARQLSGVFVRENAGFDFAAWAHVLSLCENRESWSRLYLINDSIVGPLNSPDFERLIERIRASDADVVGLTENAMPLRHVQSFFLVFNNSALRNPVVQQMFLSILSLPTKDQVIDVYETRLTQLLIRNGLRCEAMFPPMSGDLYSANDTFYRWDHLIRAGFPYVKASVLDEFGSTEQVKAMVPAEFLRKRS